MYSCNNHNGNGDHLEGVSAPFQFSNKSFLHWEVKQGKPPNFSNNPFLHLQLQYTRTE